MNRRHAAAYPLLLLVAGLPTALATSTASTADQVAQTPTRFRVLATTRTSTLEKELNEAAEAGYRFATVMGGETAIGGKEVVAVVARSGPPVGRFLYKLLATSRTSTMGKELNEAAAAGFEYRGQTIFSSLMGGQEVVVILERDNDSTERSDYTLVATARTSTLEKELREAGTSGYSVVGMTVGKTAVGGNEVVAILKRPAKH